MRVRHLRIGTLEIPLDELDAGVLEVGILRLIKGDSVQESQVTPPFIGGGPQYAIPLASDDFPANRFTLPGGPACGASGSVTVSSSGDGYRLALTVSGLAPNMEEDGHYEGWLIHDLVVPGNSDPRDLALLPSYSEGGEDPRGSVFTLDGKPPRVSDSSGGGPNTIWVPVSTGRFNTDDDGCQRVYRNLDEEGNWTFSLLELMGMRTGLGGDMDTDPRDPDEPRDRRMRLIPSGLARDILTDVFIRPATIHPELSLRHGFARRLSVITSERLAYYDGDGDGLIRASDFYGHPECFMDIREFRRFAVTKGLGTAQAGTKFIPSQKAFVLAGWRR